ncbi:hypothetical protein C2E23DRAFT_905383 [Lenzites betulinus]|nr:hypothetical protein C2E23DRAFT_905383 [Lenzites betulinus]
MSRHRFVRNMNINEELDDDYISDGGDDDLNPEDYERMMDGLEHIRATLGDEHRSALTDQDIKDSLYEYYFDVEQAIADLLEKQDRKFAARERQGPIGKPLPPPPDDEGDWSSTTDSTSGRHNVPFVRLTQSDYFSSSDQETTRASVRPGSLYTITERTERSDDDRDWEVPPPHLVQHPTGPPYMHAGGSRVTLLSSVTTDYGQVIEPSLHPEDVAVSPSPSALQRLSYQDSVGTVTPASRHTPSSSSTDTIPAPSASGAVPTLENLPDIPDMKSKSSLQRPIEPSQTSLLSKKSQKTTETAGSEKKSKLSALASSRSSARSSVSSVSAQSYNTETASDVTYPALRPSAASMASLRQEKRLPSRPSTISERSEHSERSELSESNASSFLSRVVKEAVQSAVALEALGNDAPRISMKEPTTLSIPTTRPLSSLSTTSTTPSTPKPISLKRFSQAPLPPSPGPESPPSGSPVPQAISPSTSPNQPRHLSKLARLAQAKAQEQSQAIKLNTQPMSHPSLILPRSHTEYLIPTANGPTATTAITTSYQSLGSLLTKDQSKLPPSTQYPSSSSPTRAQTSPRSPGRKEPKQSKLAMKSKSARSKPEPEPDFQPMISPIVDVPIFSPKTTRSPAKEREKAAKAQAHPQNKKATPKKPHGGPATKTAGTPPVRKDTANQSELDIAGLNLNDETPAEYIPEEPAKPPAAIEKLIVEAKAALAAQEQAEKRSLSLVVIGHVDAGKSTLMGRLLYELGRVDEKSRIANERGSSKMGKSSFSWAWELDGTQEERERGITMDIALQTLVTSHRVITILDAPGHKDFIPNMISGASQADSALLVVDAAVGEFEAGFDRGGQTREHLLLVRSLGVGQVIVAVNKLDQVEWSKARYVEICALLKPFLIQSGFHPSKTRFVPVAAMEGVNLARTEPAESPLYEWYKGPTLVDLLADTLDPPTRDFNAPLRFPISNVFKGQTSGISVSGRVCGGIIVAGERLRIIPGDESATVKAIDSDGDSLPWAGAGSNVNVTLTGVDPISLNIGSVLCRPTHLIPLVSTFSARIIVFDIQVPITAGTSVELFHHSRDVPASISRLISVMDRSNGSIIKNKPRVLTKNMSAEVEISLRNSTYSGPASRALPIPIEPFSVNKEMGRILIRRGGETIGAGVVTELLT